jgi:AcrR family transcriptional regulator
MTHLHLVESEPRVEEPALDRLGGGPFEDDLPPAARLPRGRHGIPADLVTAHQRQRLVAAAAEALAERGYAQITAKDVGERAGVSSRTFYKHFGDLWDCLAAAYEEAGGQMCDAIEASCAESTEPAARLAAGIDAALAFLAAEPAVAQLLGGRPPLDAGDLTDARRELVDRLAAMLRRARDPADDTIRPRGLEEHLIDAALAFVASRVASGATSGGLTGLGPELTELFGGSRRIVA